MNTLNENALSRSADLFYALRFLRLLTTDWKDTTAAKLGILDSDGKVIRRPKDLNTSEEKAAYTVFHRLVFNVKRLLNKVPGGKSKLASYAAALLLIKEETGIGEDSIISVLSEVVKLDHCVNESYWFEKENRVCSGIYTLKESVAFASTGEMLAKKGTHVIIEDTTKANYCFGTVVYKATHKQTNQIVYVTAEDLSR